MPKKKRSTLKRIRQTVRRTATKSAGRGSARTAVKAARGLLATGGDELRAAVTAAASALDKAAKRGAIHPNAAARRRSRIARAAAKAAKG